MNLLSDDQLERSAVVANCRMNRERNLLGSNGYDRELGFNPLTFLRERSQSQPPAWLDLCCGSGKALIQAAELMRKEGWSATIIGVDLVGMFHHQNPDVQLVEASLKTWQSDRKFDLITCVHGLHYIGDKLSLIARACSWLAPNGHFTANLDASNLKLTDSDSRPIINKLRRLRLKYNQTKRLLTATRHLTLPTLFRYLGADDSAGPNYTGQPAVNSHYEILTKSSF